MKFVDLLTAAIERSEIPLRFEPGAVEAVTIPITEILRAWIEAHEPDTLATDFERGRKALIDQLVAELEGAREVPA